VLFPRADGEPWREHDYRNWRRRVYRPIAKTGALPAPRPYNLPGSYVSLLAAAGYTCRKSRAARDTAWELAAVLREDLR
jgi:hypothetical protein